MKLSKKIFFSILAGAAIAFGGLVFLSINSLNNSILISAIAAYSFSIGLILVLVFGLWLFTGKIAYALEKKFGVLDFAIMFFFNLVGATFVGYLAFFILKTTKIYEINYASLTSKIDEFNFWKLFLSGMLCGMFVYAAVEAYKMKKIHIIIRIILVIAFIGTFVLLKLNHCVANMFYISFASAWSWKTTLFIVVNTSANSIGAILLNTLKDPIVKLINQKKG